MDPAFDGFVGILGSEGLVCDQCGVVVDSRGERSAIVVDTFPVDVDTIFTTGSVREDLFSPSVDNGYFNLEYEPWATLAQRFSDIVRDDIMTAKRHTI